MAESEQRAARKEWTREWRRLVVWHMLRNEPRVLLLNPTEQERV